MPFLKPPTDTRGIYPSRSSARKEDRNELRPTTTLSCRYLPETPSGHGPDLVQREAGNGPGAIRLRDHDPLSKPKIEMTRSLHGASRQRSKPRAGTALTAFATFALRAIISLLAPIHSSLEENWVRNGASEDEKGRPRRIAVHVLVITSFCPARTVETNEAALV